MTSELQPLIFAIKGNALDDGPGIRSVVFFKGCPLSCIWCHNPEGRKREVEISFDAGECIGCDTCISVCPENALSRENPFLIDRAACSLCFRCEQVCPSGAISRVGKSMTVDEIVKDVVRDKPFYDTSGGGVTLSGGEPTLFMDFAARLLKMLKAEGVHTLLETCGFFAWEEFDQKLYPWLDLIYFDIKLLETRAHARYCGVANKTILNNLRQLGERAKNGGTPMIPRIPLIPGITDTEENLQASAQFLGECGIRQVQLLPYHPLWREKRQMLGIQDYAGQDETVSAWSSRQTLEECKSVFGRAGVSVP